MRLFAKKEERLIAAVVDFRNGHRPSDGAPKLILLEGRQLDSISIVRPGVGIQFAVAQKVIRGNMILIRTAAGGHADDAAAGSTVLRFQRVRDDRKFLDAVDDRRVSSLQITDIVFRQDDAGAIDGNFIGRIAAAADEWGGSAAARRDAWCQRSQPEGVPTVKRQIDNLPGSDDFRNRRRLGRKLC